MPGEKSVSEQTGESVVSRELLQQALTELEMECPRSSAVDALREALAAPMPEPMPEPGHDCSQCRTSQACKSEQMCLSTLYRGQFPPAAPAPVAQKPTYSEEEVERAVITLRGITQEIRGRGIGAVMLLEEQIKSLSAAPVVPPFDLNCTCGAVWEVRGKDVELVHTAAPVVREPLTEEWIAQFFMQLPLPYEQVEKIVRHVEQAHGIGGGNG